VSCAGRNGVPAASATFDCSVAVSIASLPSMLTLSITVRGPSLTTIRTMTGTGAAALPERCGSAADGARTAAYPRRR
jgi:hypothetical protein